MSVAKSLSESQVAQIQEWADQGAGLSEIQRRLDADFGVKVTYMEVRFLIDDLKIELQPVKEPEPEPEPENLAKDEEAEAEATPVADEATGEEDAEGKVNVTISELQRPGMIVSGRVTFANGKGAEWWMDQMGRLGMKADDLDYRPSESDMLAFRRELQQVAREKGF